MVNYRLDSCVWEITLACCFSCRYCGSRGGKARENELTTAECLDICGQLADIGCRRVSLIGGEVFMRPDWAEIARGITARGMKLSVITNGFVFHDALIQKIKACGVESVAVSLDGPKPVHDRYRQAGSYDRAVGAIRALTDSGIPVSVITTLNSENAQHLEEFYAQLCAYPLFAWQLQSCSPMGNAANGAVDIHFDVHAVLRFVEEKMREAPFVIGVGDNIGYYTLRDGFVRGDPSGSSPFRGCRAGLSAVGIDSVGNVKGCESMYDPAFIEGNLRAQRLREIWESPDAFAYNRRFSADMLTGRCAHCDRGQYCAGGCRSYNYFVHQKLYEAPHCARMHQ